MKLTYKTYMTKRELHKYQRFLDIVEIEKDSMGAMVTFYCDNAKVLDEIFAEEMEIDGWVL